MATLSEVRDFHRRKATQLAKQFPATAFVHGRFADAIDTELARGVSTPPPIEDVGTTVERIAEIISGAPFPSGRSLSKARQIVDMLYFKKG